MCKRCDIECAQPLASILCT